MSRIPGHRRPATAGLVELHVFYVPEEKWDSKLNKAAVEAIDSFISAGFIRVYPDISLETLREELGGLLGTERTIDNFSFLKCVGRSLALVKAKQERELRVKSFVPPYAPQPEIYLLPMVENGDSILSCSLTPDRQNYHTDLQAYNSSKTFSVTAVRKEPTKFPQIKHQVPQEPPPVQGLDDEGSFSSSDEKEENLFPSEDPGWGDAHGPLGGVHEQSQSILEQGATEAQMKSKTCVKKGPRFHRNYARDSGVPESLDDHESGFSISQGRKSKDSPQLKYNNKNPNNQGTTRKPTTPGFLTGRDELIEQIKLAKEERKQLEKTRQALLRKGKDLLAQNRHRRNQARDSWKRRYFATKKATEPLESTLRSLRQELEAFYHKLLQQLQARDSRKKAKCVGNPSHTKNELIIQIMTESHERDKLKRKVEDAKMKVVTEMKLRKQATTELRALKAELTQKKNQSSLSGSHAGSLGNELGFQRKSQIQDISV
ncbi:hypothetical protein MATL_G00026850 [Megalops atlanticus]|uniref:Spermatogenesis-associated protein 1 C-terminal domain-containing protein n=1 Tax=Megalops atlanticus TaxID=7932 RepID=A0A9D3QC59_MEGAT|nr:hypothetical protein MATL_G00026850 [Megalops atlanticus]